MCRHKGAVYGYYHVIRITACIVHIGATSTIITAFKCNVDDIDEWWSKWVIHLNSAPTDISSYDLRLTGECVIAISAVYLSTTIYPTACTVVTGWKKLTIYKSAMFNTTIWGCCDQWYMLRIPCVHVNNYKSSHIPCSFVKEIQNINNKNSNILDLVNISLEISNELSSIQHLVTDVFFYDNM